MGNSQSNGRNLTVVNDEASGVIKISDSVVKRLQEEISSKEKTSQPKEQPAEPSGAPPPPSPPPAAEEPPIPTPPPQPPMEMPPPVIPVTPYGVPPQAFPQPPPQDQRAQRPVIHYVEEPSLASLKVRAEKEAELEETDRYWKARLASMEKEYSVLTNLQAAAAAQSIKNMSDQLDTKPVAPVCADQRKLLQECLEVNKVTPLKCSSLVKEFSHCVDAARLSYVGRTG